MNPIELLARQTADTYSWTNRLIDSVPFEKWEETPEIIETNISWQVGHLILSFYYHSVAVVVGHQMDVLQKVPLKEYNEWYTLGIPKHALGKVSPQVLREQLTLLEDKSLQVIRSLSLDDLDKELAPTQTTHPIAKTKYEALDWNVKHTMYHCGQIGMLKRILGERFDFGLRLGK